MGSHIRWPQDLRAASVGGAKIIGPKPLKNFEHFSPVINDHSLIELLQIIREYIPLIRESGGIVPVHRHIVKLICVY